ncbi:HU family DNA-binding protein [Tropicimonas sediminicola]|uniref:DNA-binding protein HU-alpha n=1 Tax=Tropicimonas sediminicola TaxID=1031541 RepID=A0A239DE40_9RHOB|nr:HU family DNA-binding protein [Tropicimonas sediminicola]SNS30188.1 DNA-binding protein HU-alpha [Tropicimonas sediminicola]
MAAQASDSTNSKPAADKAQKGSADVRKPDLVDRVVAATGAKKADVRSVVDATLAELGKALAKNDTLHLPPLGRVKVQKRKSVDGGEVLQLRVRQVAEGAAKPKRSKEKPE